LELTVVLLRPLLQTAEVGFAVRESLAISDSEESFLSSASRTGVGDLRVLAVQNENCAAIISS